MPFFGKKATRQLAAGRQPSDASELGPPNAGGRALLRVIGQTRALIVIPAALERRLNYEIYHNNNSATRPDPPFFFTHALIRHCETRMKEHPDGHVKLAASQTVCSGYSIFITT